MAFMNFTVVIFYVSIFPQDYKLIKDKDHGLWLFPF